MVHDKNGGSFVGSDTPALNGVIVVDKPTGWTSHDVVGKMRRFAGTKKIGHLGTLDPLATGVLPLVIGRATRLAQFFTANSKTYEGVIHFGFSTDSYDSDGEPTSEPIAVTLEHEKLDQILDRFRGEFLQTPPPISAKKIAGRPAYELARRQKPVELKSVQVRVDELHILSIDGPSARVRIRCSAGTYVRGIAHEAGLAFGCGAHLSELRRLASGDFTIENARTLEELGRLATEGRLYDALIPASELLPQFPSEFVDQASETGIRNGRNFRGSPFHARPESRYVKAISASGELIAIGETVLPNVYHPILVL